MTKIIRASSRDFAREVGKALHLANNDVKTRKFARIGERAPVFARVDDRARDIASSYWYSENSREHKTFRNTSRGSARFLLESSYYHENSREFTRNYKKVGDIINFVISRDFERKGNRAQEFTREEKKARKMASNVVKTRDFTRKSKNWWEGTRHYVVWQKRRLSGEYKKWDRERWLVRTRNFKNLRGNVRIRKKKQLRLCEEHVRSRELVTWFLKNSRERARIHEIFRESGREGL